MTNILATPFLTTLEMDSGPQINTARRLRRADNQSSASARAQKVTDHVGKGF
jgi:hypothetical protein